MNTYKALNKQVYTLDDYSLVPIRREDRYDIMQWRNEQISLLRQAELLTKEKQDWYFENVVAELFDQKQPKQILFSFLKNRECIGYGGLVHIDWQSKNAEISFLLDTERNSKVEYLKHSEIYFRLILKVAETLSFKKVYTYGYDLSSYRFKPLYLNGYKLEAYLHDQVLIENEHYGVRIYSKLI